MRFQKTVAPFLIPALPAALRFSFACEIHREDAENAASRRKDLQTAKNTRTRLPMSYALLIALARLPIAFARTPIALARLPIAFAHLPIAFTHLPIAFAHLPIASARPPIASARPPIASARLPIASAHLPIALARLPIAFARLPIAFAPRRASEINAILRAGVAVTGESV